MKAYLTDAYISFAYLWLAALLGEERLSDLVRLLYVHLGANPSEETMLGAPANVAAFHLEREFGLPKELQFAALQFPHWLEHCGGERLARLTSRWVA